MNNGLSLVELLVSMAIASVLLLVLLSMHILSGGTYTETRDNWYCMQSLRNTLVRLDADLRQCACLMPQDLNIAFLDNHLFIAGVPVTSTHGPLKPPQKQPPPLYSVVRSSYDNTIVVDTVDIDSDGVPDYWADLGIITDSGPWVISHTYSRGDTRLRLTSDTDAAVGERIVPAVHYELKSDGLYRNSQLIAEALSLFATSLDGSVLTVCIQAGNDSASRQISYPFTIR